MMMLLIIVMMLIVNIIMMMTMMVKESQIKVCIYSQLGTPWDQGASVKGHFY